MGRSFSLRSPQYDKDIRKRLRVEAVAIRAAAAEAVARRERIERRARLESFLRETPFVIIVASHRLWSDEPEKTIRAHDAADAIAQAFNVSDMFRADQLRQILSRQVSLPSYTIDRFGQAEAVVTIPHGPRVRAKLLVASSTDDAKARLASIGLDEGKTSRALQAALIL